MKTTTLKRVLGSALLAGTFALLPSATFAASATSSTSVHIGGNGIVRIINAEVTSISGNIINAVTNFKNNIVNWTITTNASTTIAANNSLTASTTDIHVGDKLRVTGPLSVIGSTLGVTATKVKDVTSTQSLHTKVGKIQSVNTANGTFVITTDNKQMTVQTNSATVLKNGTTTVALASLAVNSYVKVTGVTNADTTVITASSVTVFPIGKDIRKMDKTWKEAFKNFKHDWKSGHGNHDK